jgi:hypothetical protein
MLEAHAGEAAGTCRSRLETGSFIHSLPSFVEGSKLRDPAWLPVGRIVLLDRHLAREGRLA